MRSTEGSVYIFANSHHPEQTIVVAETCQAADLDAVASVDKSVGWICVFSAMVADVPANLQALTRELRRHKIEQLDHQMPLPPVVVVNALRKIVTGERWAD